MKIMQEVVEVSGEGLGSLIGKKITVFCANYFYTGKLIGVNTTCIKLQDPAIVYDTGDFKTATYLDVQALGVKEFYIQIAFIESFGVLK